MQHRQHYTSCRHNILFICICYSLMLQHFLCMRREKVCLEVCVYVKGHCGDQLKFYSNFLRKTNKLLLLSSICSCHYTKNLQPGQFINYICSTKTSCLLVISYVATRLSLVLYIEEEIFHSFFF